MAKYYTNIDISNYDTADKIEEYFRTLGYLNGQNSQYLDKSSGCPHANWMDSNKTVFVAMNNISVLNKIIVIVAKTVDSTQLEQVKLMFGGNPTYEDTTSNVNYSYYEFIRPDLSAIDLTGVNSFETLKSKLEEYNYSAAEGNSQSAGVFYKTELSNINNATGEDNELLYEGATSYYTLLTMIGGLDVGIIFYDTTEHLNTSVSRLKRFYSNENNYDSIYYYKAFESEKILLIYHSNIGKLDWLDLSKMQTLAEAKEQINAQGFRDIGTQNFDSWGQQKTIDDNTISIRVSNTNDITAYVYVYSTNELAQARYNELKTQSLGDNGWQRLSVKDKAVIAYQLPKSQIFIYPENFDTTQMQTQEEVNSYLTNAGYTFVESINVAEDAPAHSYTIASIAGTTGAPEGAICQAMIKVSNIEQRNQILVQYAYGVCFDTAEHAATYYGTMKSQMTNNENTIVLRLDNDNKFILYYLIEKGNNGGSTENKRTFQLDMVAVNDSTLYNVLTAGSHIITVAGVDSNNAPGPQSNSINFEVTEVPLTFNITGGELSEISFRNNTNEQQNPNTCRSFGGHFIVEINGGIKKAIKSITILDNEEEILSGNRNSYTGKGCMDINTTSADFYFNKQVSNVTINCELENEVWYAITTQNDIPDQIDSVIVQGVTDQGISSLNPFVIKVKLKNPTQYTITRDCITPNQTLQGISFDKDSGCALLAFSAPTEAMYIHINAIPVTTYTLTAQELPEGYSLLTNNISNALYNEVKIQGPINSIAQTQCSVSNWEPRMSQYNLENGIYTFWFGQGFNENGVLRLSVYDTSTIEKEKIIPQLVVNSSYDGVGASLSRGYCLPRYNIQDENGRSLRDDTILLTKPEGDTNTYMLSANLTEGNGKIWNITNDSLMLQLFSNDPTRITINIEKK